MNYNIQDIIYNIYFFPHRTGENKQMPQQPQADYNVHVFKKEIFIPSTILIKRAQESRSSSYKDRVNSIFYIFLLKMDLRTKIPLNVFQLTNLIASIIQFFAILLFEKQ